MKSLGLGLVFCFGPSSMPPLEAPAKLGKRECFKQVLFILFLIKVSGPKAKYYIFFYYLKSVIIS